VKGKEEKIKVEKMGVAEKIQENIKKEEIK
jgi:hypothetical protein